MEDEDINDKDLMERLLLTVCTLYMHRTIDSTPGQIRQAFTKALNKSLCM